LVALLVLTFSLSLPTPVAYADILGASASPPPRWLLSPATTAWEVTIHTFTRGRARACEWAPKDVVLRVTGGRGGGDGDGGPGPRAEAWAAAIRDRAAAASTSAGCDRPRTVLAIINPYGGRAAAQKVWERVGRPILESAGCASAELVTARAGHAREAVAGLTPRELAAYDGIVAVGGDGLFQEVLEGLADARARAGAEVERGGGGSGGGASVPAAAATLADASRLRLGHIPAGSTDAVAFSLHGTRSPATAALHIALGDRAALDVMEVRAPVLGTPPQTPTSTPSSSTPPPTPPIPPPCPSITRAAVCMAAYGYFGDLLALSERLRVLGPARYTVAGVAAFVGGRAYHTTVAWRPPGGGGGRSASASPPCVGPGCVVCEDGKDAPLLPAAAAAVAGEAEAEDGEATQPPTPRPPSPPAIPPGWLSRTAAFKAVLIASLPCRSDQSVHGLAPGRHLSDGRASLILVGPCSRWAFLAFLLSIPRTGIVPGAFPAFVEVLEAEEVRVLPVAPSGGGKNPGAAGWNCDGEPLPPGAAAGGVGVRVGRGAVQVFSRGVEA